MRQATRHRCVRAAAAAMLVLCSPVRFSGVAAAQQDGDSRQTAVQLVSKRIEAHVEAEPRAAAPGAAVKLRYIVSSYEDQDERIRLRVETEPGWRLLGSGLEQRERLLERWENIEGELYLVVPDSATLGARQPVRLIVELVGESGVIHTLDHVTVSRRGGIKPGVPTISATMTIGLFGLGARGAQKARSVAVSTKFGRSTFSLFYDHGLRGNLSNFRFEEQRTRLSGTLRHAGWDLTFGNYLSSSGDTLTGPHVLGRGLSLTRPAGRLMVELAAAQPNTIGGVAGGHLLRARTGFRTSGLTVALVASDFGRPLGGYTTLSSVQQTLVDADTEERRDVERRLTANAASNRATGLGIDAELRPEPQHRLALKAGGLWLSSGSGTRAGGLAAEAGYMYSSRAANIHLRWRRTPAAVPGIVISPDEVSADGGVRLAGAVRLVGYTYQSTADTIASDLWSGSRGASFGVRFARGGRRLEVRGNHRQTQFTARHLRRTISVGLGAPVGPLSISATADVGRQDRDWQAGSVAFYRGELRWPRGGSPKVTFTATHSEGSGTRRQRADLIVSWKMRDLEVAGGAWGTRGYASGGAPGAWTTVGFPIGGDRFLTLGVDYSSPSWSTPPTFRGMIAVRQALTLPMPFFEGLPLRQAAKD